MPGLFMQDVKLRQDRGTAQTVVTEFWVCGNRAVTLHLAQEARHKARALRESRKFKRRASARSVGSFRCYRRGLLWSQ
jgi:hypothetical protein